MPSLGKPSQVGAGYVGVDAETVGHVRCTNLLAGIDEGNDLDTAISEVLGLFALGQRRRSCAETDAIEGPRTVMGRYRVFPFHDVSPGHREGSGATVALAGQHKDKICSASDTVGSANSVYEIVPVCLPGVVDGEDGSVR